MKKKEKNIGERLFNIKDIVEKTGIRSQQIYKMVKEKKFPEYIELSRKNRLWREVDVNEWVNNKINERGAV